MEREKVLLLADWLFFFFHQDLDMRGAARNFTLEAGIVVDVIAIIASIAPGKGSTNL